MQPENFVSLGDNCEFGFVQRRHGSEPGGLLRWAVTSPDALIQILKTNFSDVYQLGNLSPSSRDMVYDSGTGLYLHTRMHSENGNFIHSEQERASIWEEEKSKIDYMCDKIRQEVAEGKKIFVYKSNAGVDEHRVLMIASALADKGDGKLLYVTKDSDRNVGEVWKVKNNLYYSKIDRFANYDTADKASYEVWNLIMLRAAALML